MTDLFALGARRLDWLAHRESLIARNVANADTPGFRPSDLKPFEDSFETTAARLARTSAAHFGDGPGASAGPRAGAARSWETTLSGNAVSIEQELARSAETTRAAGAASAAVKAFHRLSLAVLKG
jgi:flagellar basal-body rod protein FlgB